jgi:hypothetical protein
MNPELLELDLPSGTLPDLSDRVRSFEENDRWHTENRRLRSLRGDLTTSPGPVEVPFTTDEWPL